MSMNKHSSDVSSRAETPGSLPALPASFTPEASGDADREARRRLIRKIIVGVPTVVAMTARGATANHTGTDIVAASAPSNPSQ